MGLVLLAAAYLRRRWGQALLSMVVGALGISAVATAMIGIEALPEAAQRSWGGVDLVVGPKGSALDLVLCCALHVADPRGIIPQNAAMEALRNPMIAAAAPIALGDSVRGWRIMGTTPRILAVYEAEVASGRMWEKPLEAVLGARAAQALNLGPGGAFLGAHGMAASGEEHAEFHYTVVGVLAPTGSALDRLVLSDIETVRIIHEAHARELAAESGVAPRLMDAPPTATAIVASYRSPVAAVQIPRMIDATPAFSAGSPTFEIARLMSYLRPLTLAATGLGVLLVGIAAAGAAAGLMATMNARTRDLALLRALGAGPLKTGLVAFAEASMIAAAALAAGAMATWLLIALAARELMERFGLLLTPHFELRNAAYVIAGTAVAAAAAALFPAIRAARTPIEELLQS